MRLAIILFNTIALSVVGFVVLFAVVFVWEVYKTEQAAKRTGCDRHKPAFQFEACVALYDARKEKANAVR